MLIDSRPPSVTMIETAWERQMNLTGTGRYDLQYYSKNGKVEDAAEVTTGKQLTRKIVLKVSDAIARHQKNHVSMKGSPLDTSSRASVVIVPPETCALITVKEVINSTTNKADGANLQRLCKAIGKSIETELNFRTWVYSSRENAREYAKLHGLETVTVSIAERLIQDQGVSRMTMRRWKNAFADLSTHRWSDFDLHYCGEVMVEALLEALPDYFEKTRLCTKSKWESLIVMKPEIRARFFKSEADIASAQAVKKPMLARPRPWTKKESKK